MKEGEASKKLVFEWKGDVLLNFCYSITLYAPDLSAPQRKEAVLAIFDDYVSLYGARMNWTTNPVSGAWKPLHGRADGYLMPGEWLMHKPEEDGYAFLFHGGEKKADASDVSFMVMARGQRDADCKDLSYLCCRFPGADVREEKVDMAGLMRRWCGLLQPLHGRGGCSAGWRYDAAMTPAIADMLSDMLKTCPGLQFDGTPDNLYDEEQQSGLYHGPRCADWLIALSDPLLEKLGGLDAVTDAMRPCPVLPYEGGGFKFCPEASPADGELDVIIVYGLPVVKILCLLPLAFWGKHTGFKGVVIKKCSGVRIRTGTALPLHTDGEPGFPRKEIGVSLMGERLKVIAG